MGRSKYKPVPNLDQNNSLNLSFQTSYNFITYLSGLNEILSWGTGSAKNGSSRLLAADNSAFGGLLMGMGPAFFRSGGGEGDCCLLSSFFLFFAKFSVLEAAGDGPGEEGPGEFG